MTLKMTESFRPEADTLVLGLGTDTEANGQSVPSLGNLTQRQRSCRGHTPSSIELARTLKVSLRL